MQDSISLSKKDIPVILALEMVKSKTVELFLDQVKKPYIAIKQEDHTQTMPVQSRMFGDWLTATFYFESKQKDLSEAQDNLTMKMKTKQNTTLKLTFTI